MTSSPCHGNDSVAARRFQAGARLWLVPARRGAGWRPREPRMVGTRMALLTTERLFWHCGAHTTEPKISHWGPIPQFLITKNLLCYLGTWESVCAVRCGAAVRCRGHCAHDGVCLKQVTVIRSNGAWHETAESNHVNISLSIFSLDSIFRRPCVGRSSPRAMEPITMMR